jgi:hypothetical protein
MPPINSANSSGLSVMQAEGPAALGQLKRPLSNRLAQSHKPWPSQNKIFAPVALPITKERPMTAQGVQPETIARQAI